MSGRGWWASPLLLLLLVSASLSGSARGGRRSLPDQASPPGPPWALPRPATTSTPCQNNGNRDDSFLWTIQRDPPSFFFGTIHVPYPRVWRHIPENAKEAFYRSDSVFLELDLTDPYTLSALDTCQLLPDGGHLASVIPRDLFLRIQRHLEYVRGMIPGWMTEAQKGRGLYAEYIFQAITANWERKRPVWIMLMVNSLTEPDVQARGVPVLDLYLAQEAQRLSKRTGAVERVEEQCLPLNALSVSQMVFALNQTLWRHEAARRHTPSDTLSTEHLIHHYNCGTLDAMLFSQETAKVPNMVNMSLQHTDLTEAKQIDQYFRQELIFKRNQRMAVRIDELLTNHPNKSFFFALGAGHFLGNGTILDALGNKGYDIQHTAADTELQFSEKFKKRRRKMAPLLADLSTGDSLSPVIVNSNLQYLDPFYDRRRNRHRQRHRQQRERKERRRNQDAGPTHSLRPQPPHFADLWVRIESPSYAPGDVLPVAMETSPAPDRPVYAMYNHTSPLVAPPGATSLVTWCLCCLLLRHVLDFHGKLQV